MENFNKGSIWRVWDLQVQTILDDGYISLSSYADDLKSSQPDDWARYIAKVGGEENALLFDSIDYFNDTTKLEKERYSNYARNLFSFLEVFKPDLGMVGFTDHNYNNSQLLDALYEYSLKSKCKCLCGVEINASGVHMLTFFDKPPLGKQSFSEGIKSFLDSIDVTQRKTNGVYTVSGQSVESITKVINKLGGIYMFPHCNSDNGLFQERTKTDRTYLAQVFNHQPVILLQAGNYDSAQKTSNYINTKTADLTSHHVFTTSPDSRRLLDIGAEDSKGYRTWIKADQTFAGLKQILIESDRVEIADRPQLVKRVQANKTKFMRGLSIKKTDGVTLNDIWFDNFEIEFNSGLIAIIGNKGSGKSAIADIIGVCGNTHQDPQYFSFLTSTKFRKSRPTNLAEKFVGYLSWEDETILEKSLNLNPDKNLPERVKYIPQNFLETVCANVESDKFERELKDIIYHHTPSDQRFNKASLDELIEYKSNLIHDEIQVLKAQLSKLNTEIALLENKATASYKSSIENEIQLRRNELIAHEGAVPKKPDAQEGAIKSDEVLKLEALRKEQERLENLINTDRTEKAGLAIEVEELSQASQHFNSLRDQLQKQLDENNQHNKILFANGIAISDVFSFKIDTSKILDKIQAKNTQLSTINERLNELTEGSNAFLLKQTAIQIKNGQEELDKPAREQQKYLSDLKTWTDRKAQIEGTKETEGSLNYLLGQAEYLEKELKPQLERQYTSRNEIVRELFVKKDQLTSERKKLFQPVTQFIEDFRELKERYDVKFDVMLEFKSFIENFFGFVNQAKSGTFYGKDEGFKRLSDMIERAHFENAESFVSFADELIQALKSDMRDANAKPIEPSTQLKSGKSLNDLYDFIFGFDYLQPVYNLKLGDKTLQELSPGERGALLLIFYLILDDDDIPLIIDQPEENLDNESVYHILVHFIKKVKEKRQIVIVTHNPNLAVVCDADQIIHMSIDKKDKNRVSFISGAIEFSKINQSVVNILEGTLPAFSNRDAKYIRPN